MMRDLFREARDIDAARYASLHRPVWVAFVVRGVLRLWWTVKRRALTSH